MYAALLQAAWGLLAEAGCSSFRLTFAAAGCMEEWWPELVAMGEAQADAAVQRMFSSYFVFTTARDPFARAVSMYHFLLSSTFPEPAECRSLVRRLTGWLGRRVPDEWMGGWMGTLLALSPFLTVAQPQIDWDTFCNNPVSFVQACRQHPHCCFAMPEEGGNGALRECLVCRSAPCWRAGRLAGWLVPEHPRFLASHPALRLVLWQARHHTFFSKHRACWQLEAAGEWITQRVRRLLALLRIVVLCWQGLALAGSLHARLCLQGTRQVCGAHLAAVFAATAAAAAAAAAVTPIGFATRGPPVQIPNKIDITHGPWPASPSLLPGCSLAVDFVARQEHLEMDVATVAGIINLRRPIGQGCRLPRAACHVQHACDGGVLLSKWQDCAHVTASTARPPPFTAPPPVPQACRRWSCQRS